MRLRSAVVLPARPSLGASVRVAWHALTTTMEVVAVNEREAVRRELIGLVARPPAPVAPTLRTRTRPPSPEWWLIRGNRGVSCEGCPAWLHEGSPMVFCKIGPRCLCRACARRRGIRWRIARSMRVDQRRRESQQIPVLDAASRKVLDALRQRSDPFTAAELRAVTGLEPEVVASALSMLKKGGTVARRGHRGWVPASARRDRP